MRYAIALMSICLAIKLHGENLCYPISKPYADGYLQVSEKHYIYYASYGNPNGIPTVVLHGGPGIGCSDDYTCYFDLNKWHVIMLDQRGAMRSLPFGCMEDNTTTHLVSDLEILRNHLKIPSWVVFGNSWGSCLALVYGQTYPESCLGFVLEGVFLGRKEDITIFKDMDSALAYEELWKHLSKDERPNNEREAGHVVYQKLMNPNPKIHMAMAKALMRYQLLNAPNPPSVEMIEQILSNDRHVLSFMRSLVHYAVHDCFLEPNQIFVHLTRISHLPAMIVHGSLDTVCAPQLSQLLHLNWGSQSVLWMIDGAGHSRKDPAIVNALVEATNSMYECMVQARGCL